MNDSTPFLSGVLFLIGCGWLAILLSSCGGPVDPPVNYCAGSPALGHEGPVQPGIAAIVNGTESTDRRGTVLVGTTKGSCTGTIIGPHTVLTAAHCEGDSPKIRIGDGPLLYATEVLQHPDYVRFPYDDVSLFFFDELLPEPHIELYYYGLDGDSCVGFIAQGYGVGGGGKLTEKPYQVLRVGVRILRTIGEDGSTCWGDSGGPLYAVDADGTVRLAGSLSTGFDDACYAGGHHVRLDYYADWIEEHRK